MMRPLMTFEAQSLRSHAPYFLIEHINLVIERFGLSFQCFIGSLILASAHGLALGPFFILGGEGHAFRVVRAAGGPCRVRGCRENPRIFG